MNKTLKADGGLKSNCIEDPFTEFCVKQILGFKAYNIIISVYTSFNQGCKVEGEVKGLDEGGEGL